MATFSGNDTSENYPGTAGADLIDGGGGNDTLIGAGGIDTINGGSGSDSVNGGAGNDLLRWISSENTGVTDIYLGGSGTDTVRFEFDAATWGDAAVRAAIVGYVNHLAAGQAANPYNVVVNGNTITLDDIERWQVLVDGQQIALRAPGFDGGDVTGAVTEDAGVTLTDSGTFGFYDVDLAQAHTVAVLAGPDAPLGGTLTAALSNPATGDGEGTVGWSYSVANAAVQSLAAGQTVTETFTVQVRDPGGARLLQPIAVTVTGVNDGPVVTDYSGDATILEDSGGEQLSANGTVSFGDVDLTDTHTVTVTNAAGNLFNGALEVSLADDATGDGAGSVNWLYTVSNEALQELGPEESATETFTITIDDGNGGTVEQQVVVTLTGTDDDQAPGTVIEEVTGVLALTEDVEVNESGFVATGGTITFSEAVAVGAHSVEFASVGDTLGFFSVGIVDDTDGDGFGGMLWFYAANNQSLQGLAQGETAVDTFTVSLTDSFDQVVTRDVSITLVGTNDLPTTTSSMLATNRNEAQSFQLLAFDADSSDTLTFGLSTQATNGVAAVNADGTYTYTPNVGYVGTDSFTYSVTDSAEAEVTGVVSVRVGNGTSTKNIVGTTGRDLLIGGTGNDTLNGGAGSDVIEARGGADRIITGDDGDIVIFRAAPGSGIDRITDFNPEQDVIYLSNASGNFSALTLGDLAPEAFDIIGDATAATAATRIQYNAANGALFYDTDGTGASAAVQFAVLGNVPTISADSFFITG